MGMRTHRNTTLHEYLNHRSSKQRGTQKPPRGTTKAPPQKKPQTQEGGLRPRATNARGLPSSAIQEYLSPKPGPSRMADKKKKKASRSRAARSARRQPACCYDKKFLMGGGRGGAVFRSLLQNKNKKGGGATKEKTRSAAPPWRGASSSSPAP